MFSCQALPQARRTPWREPMSRQRVTPSLPRRSNDGQPFFPFPGNQPPFRGLHSFTFQLNLSRVNTQKHPTHP
jgi:hypothetical protein